MARIIPNDKTWVGFATSIANTAAPTTAELTAATDLTPFVISITAQSQGNTVPTPTLDNTFETNIQGTVSATFTADFYRDDSADTAWSTLSRSTKGYMLISRFGGTGTNAAPAQNQTVEVWPVIVTSRSASALASNTAQTFTVSCAVFDYPNEGATVTSSTSVPTVPTNLTVALSGANPGATATVSLAGGTVLFLDWDVPSYMGTPAATAYKIYKVSNATTNAGQVQITSGLVLAGTTAQITSSTNAANLTSTGTWYLKVAAVNSNGEGPLSTAYVTITANA